jgi:hypothetical protein
MIVGKNAGVQARVLKEITLIRVGQTTLSDLNEIIF